MANKRMIEVKAKNGSLLLIYSSDGSQLLNFKLSGKITVDEYINKPYNFFNPQTMSLMYASLSESDYDNAYWLTHDMEFQAISDVVRGSTKPKLDKTPKGAVN